MQHITVGVICLFVLPHVFFRHSTEAVLLKPMQLARTDGVAFNLRAFHQHQLWAQMSDFQVACLAGLPLGPLKWNSKPPVGPNLLK